MDALSRSRLCKLAEVEPSRHQRWLRSSLLERRKRYTTADAIRAAALDQMRIVLGNECAERVWIALRAEPRLTTLAQRLELVVDPDTESWTLAEDDASLARAVKRDGRTAVVDLGGRIERVRTRAARYSKPRAAA